MPAMAAERLLGGLGGTTVAGYLALRLVRRRLMPSGWDVAEFPVLIAGSAPAAATAMIGLRPAITRGADQGEPPG